MLGKEKEKRKRKNKKNASDFWKRKGRKGSAFSCYKVFFFSSH